MCGGKAAYRPSGYAKPRSAKELYAYAKVLWEEKYGKKEEREDAR